MTDVVIRAEGVGKSYILGHRAKERVPTLRDAITRGLTNFARSARDLARGRPVLGGDHFEDFWALRDVNFQISRGDVVGVIGRNGAGKSTLLKILARITEPSEGRVSIKGRVASLLEVGTGFHPELTGRENIFLNGAILGMSQREIRSQFDAIVDFAGVERFLDTAVKRYSSGMYVRLAFAVAAHLEPEILIVDEVLAVGDAQFQAKCLGKMQDVAKHGRTVLFVSHNMAAITRLCRSAILMSAGHATSYASVLDAQAVYLKNGGDEDRWTAGPGMEYEYFTPEQFWFEAPRTIRIRGTVHDTAREFVIAIRVSNTQDEDIFWTTHRDVVEFAYLRPGTVEFAITLPEALPSRDYYAEIVTFLNNDRFIIPVNEGPKIAIAIPQYSRGSEFFDAGRPGIIVPVIEWAHETVR